MRSPPDHLVPCRLIGLRWFLGSIILRGVAGEDHQGHGLWYVRMHLRLPDIHVAKSPHASGRQEHLHASATLTPSVGNHSPGPYPFSAMKVAP